MKALLSIHPAWSDVAQLDQLIAHISNLPAAPPSTSIPLPEAALPRPLPAEIQPFATIPPAPSGPRRAAVDRISRLRESLDEHTRRVMDRERKAMEKRLEAEVAVERSRIKALPRKQVIARNPADEKELRKLEFEAIALESQIRVLFEPALKQAQDRLNVVAARIKELQAPPSVREEVQHAEIEKQVDSFRSMRQAAMEKELSQREAQVRATAQQAVAAYRTGLRDRLREATPPPIVRTPEAPVMPNPVLPSPSVLAAAATNTDGSAVSGADARLTGLRTQRTRLVTVITEDLRRRIEGLATQYHWTLVAEGAGLDLTSRAAELLRQQFIPVSAGQ